VRPDRPGSSLLARLDRTGVPLLLARLVLGALFIVMGARKIGDPFTFLKLLRQYEALPAGGWMNSVAVILPWVETICGAALILGVAVRGAGLLSAGMLAAFTPLIFSRGLELFRQAHGALTFCAVKFDCGCGAGEVFLCNKLAENTGLFLLALVVILSRSRRFCLSRVLWPSGAAAQPAA